MTYKYTYPPSRYSHDLETGQGWQSNSYSASTPPGCGWEGTLQGGGGYVAEIDGQFWDWGHRE